MIIDSHHHFWNPEERDYYWMGGDVLAPIRRPIGPEDMRPHLQAKGVEGTIIVQTVPTVEETEEFLATAAATDFVKGVIGWVDLQDPKVHRVLAEILSGPHGHYLKGIRHQAHDEEDKSWLARPEVIQGIKACGDAGLVYDLLPKEPELPSCITCVDALPDVQFVLDHIAKPRIAEGALEPWVDLVSELAKRPNVACKLSGMVTEADWENWTVDHLRQYANVILEVFGPDRVMFGSDWPVCLLAGDYADIFEAAQSLTGTLSPEDQRKVFGQNAARIYRLDV
ncbi:amidohydrolase family protein [Cognatishimia activa]|uniref:Putative metal-dependent hydrolase of the TIM-barrel fold protein n=1 Tax=Cognatishimia activa TaxID=1715691 RepID=A0A0P1IPX5_9RHOB|nr:amidohydrolase family protein [Cognatishimia activa]CUI89004.1 putative metal-dependent hydrolase of the TIM-barrel fold protein [Cognatishimia activa]CUK25657.1 putative metal-dependent hydrolase of the TIM-barrel fold protein [Cognatishimia activa]